MWLVFALLSAIFAALTSILAKMGIDKLSIVLTMILAFFLLHEQFTVKSLVGCILIGIGTFVMVI